MNQETTLNLSNEEILHKYKKNYGKKICAEKNYDFNFTEREKNLISKYQNPCCGKNGFIACAIITLIFNCAAIYFAISRNDGYKAYKFALEKNITSISKNFPDDTESLKLINYLNKNERLDSNEPCTYNEYRQELCTYSQYASFCTLQKYQSGECLYMDYLIYNNRYNYGYLSFCTLEQYEANKCSYQQYMDYLDINSKAFIYDIPTKIAFTSDSMEDNSVNVYYLRGYSFQEVWCKIGEYDMKIYESSLVFLVLYIFLLFFDKYGNQKPKRGIKNYLITIFYIIFYVVLRIFIILYLFLFVYSIIILFIYPPSYVYNYNFNSDEEESGDFKNFFKETKKDQPETVSYKKKRLYIVICTGIHLLLFIFFCIISAIYRIIYSLLLFDSNNNNNDNNNLEEKKIECNLKIRNKSYPIILIQDQELYLNEVETDKIYEFKKILYNDNYYYLKSNNIGLKDQLSWTEFKYPRINECFSNLTFLLKILLTIFIMAYYMSIFQFHDEYIYKYFNHLIKLGYKPKYYKYFEKSGDLNKYINDTIFISYIIFIILILIPIVKRAFFGGFVNIFLSIGCLIISILFSLVQLIFLIASIYLEIYLILSIIAMEKIQFEDDDMVQAKLWILSYLNGFTSLILIVCFAYSIKLPIYLFNVIMENNMIDLGKKRREETFIYTSLKSENKILEVNNEKEIASKLFYQLKNIENLSDYESINSVNQPEEEILGIELMKEECLNESDEAEYFSYMKDFLCFKGLIGNIIFLIVISGCIFIFIIVNFSTLIKNDKYYRDYREFLLQLESFEIAYNLPTFAKFWCDFGGVEVDVVVSFFIFIILFLVFEIMSLLLHKNILKFLDITQGKFKTIVILINLVFYILFLIYSPLFFYLLVYSIIVTACSPLQPKMQSNQDGVFGFDLKNNPFETLWKDNKATPIVNCVSIFILFILSIQLTKIKNSIIRYINEEYENDDKKEREKDTILVMNDGEYKAKIKVNNNIYIKDINNEENIYKSKKIFIEGITNDYIYVKLGNNCITEQISVGEWDYPIINETFNQLSAFAKQIYIILILSVPLFKLHVADEKNFAIYISPSNIILRSNKGPAFNSVFSAFGDFEKGTLVSRFILYIICLVIVLFLLLYRIFFGGFKKSIFYKILVFICVYFVLQNCTFVILNFLLLIFSALSISSYYDGYFELKDEMIQSKLIIQSIFSIPIFSISISLLISSIYLLKHINNIKNDFSYFISGTKNENAEQKITQFKYISLNDEIHTLKMYEKDKLQNYLYFTENNMGHAQSESQVNLILRNNN